MYNPSVHQIKDTDSILALIKEYPFAILITQSEVGPVATHLPVLVEQNDPLILGAHMAKANPHWKFFESGTPSMLIFNGPHTYISPSRYVTRPNVPTWNYVAIHAYGDIEVVSDPIACVDHLKTMVDAMDPNLKASHPESTEVELLRSKLSGVVVFRMKVDRLEAKAKLNQNKPEQDRLAVRDQLFESSDPQEVRMAQMMNGD